MAVWCPGRATALTMSGLCKGMAQNLARYYSRDTDQSMHQCSQGCHRLNGQWCNHSCDPLPLAVSSTYRQNVATRTLPEPQEVKIWPWLGTGIVSNCQPCLWHHSLLLRPSMKVKHLRASEEDLAPTEGGLPMRGESKEGEGKVTIWYMQRAIKTAILK